MATDQKSKVSSVLVEIANIEFPLKPKLLMGEPAISRSWEPDGEIRTTDLEFRGTWGKIFTGSFRSPATAETPEALGTHAPQSRAVSSPATCPRRVLSMSAARLCRSPQPGRFAPCAGRVGPCKAFSSQLLQRGLCCSRAPHGPGIWLPPGRHLPCWRNRRPGKELAALDPEGPNS